MAKTSKFEGLSRLILKIDTHIHTWYSDSTASPIDVLRIAHLRGLDGVAITDHDTLKGAKVASRMEKRLIIIPGEEIKTDRGEILALGIKKVIPRKLPITEAIREAHSQNGLVIIPHPTLPFFSKIRENDIGKLPIDGIEVISAITPLPIHFFRRNIKLAQRLGLPMTAGSDSHSPETVGDAYTLVNSESRDLEDILNAIRDGKTAVVYKSSRFIFKVRMIKIFFKLTLHRPFI